MNCNIEWYSFVSIHLIWNSISFSNVVSVLIVKQNWLCFIDELVIIRWRGRFCETSKKYNICDVYAREDGTIWNIISKPHFFMYENQKSKNCYLNQTFNYIRFFEIITCLLKKKQYFWLVGKIDFLRIIRLETSTFHILYYVVILTNYWKNYDLVGFVKFSKFEIICYLFKCD